MTNLSLAQLRHTVSIKERIDGLQVELNQLFGKSVPAAPTARLAPAASASAPTTDGRRGRKRSAAVRARMAAAQQARWANKGKTPVAPTKGATKAPPAVSAKKRKRNFSLAALARISAAAKARWAKAKASGKRRLG